MKRQFCGRLLKVMVVAILVATVSLAQHETYVKSGNTRDNVPKSVKLTRLAASPELQATLAKRIALKLQNAPLRSAIKEVSEKAGIVISYSDDLLPEHKKVTLDTEEISVSEALGTLLMATGLDWTGEGNSVILVREDVVQEETGTIVGRVLEARTNKPLPGVNVVVEGATRGAMTNTEGIFKIERVPPGNYKLKASLVGYAKIAKDIAVRVGNQTTMDFFLDETAVGLNEVVVTGVAFETNKRAVPSPINVMTAKDIEQKGSTSFTNLVRGEIPGLMALYSGQVDHVSNIYVRGNTGLSTEDFVKIYVDGVELASSRLVSTIDPQNIERIEVVRGPQASTIYGSEAASGVLQIFTKKGGGATFDRPTIGVSTSVGYIESIYKPTGVVPLTQDHGLTISGGMEKFSYRAGISYSSVGKWLKTYQSELLSFSASAQVLQGPFSAEVTALWSSRDMRYANSPIYDQWPKSDNCVTCGQPDLDYPKIKYKPSQTTLGLTLKYSVVPEWQQTLTLGTDQNRFTYYQYEAHRLTPTDTLMQFGSTEYQRQSIRYNTAYSMNLLESMLLRVSVGADYMYYTVVGGSADNLIKAYGTVITGTQTYPHFSNNNRWNAGYFALAELSMWNRLYWTAATRIEENPNYGSDYKRAVSPRIGVSYVHKLDPLEIKLRGQFGQGTRPPLDFQRDGRVTEGYIILPNPDLGPEVKVGWDAGIEFYWGRTASFALTRYDEVGKNLIQSIYIKMTGFPRITQYKNFSRIGTKGWEAEGSYLIGPVTLKANYSYADNRILAMGYMDPNTSTSAIYKVGERMEYVPTHSGGGTVNVQFWRGNAQLNYSFIGDWRAWDLENVYASQMGLKPWPASVWDYIIEYKSFIWRFNASVEQQVTDGITAFLRADNLTNNQDGDMMNIYKIPGRTTTIGLKITY